MKCPFLELRDSFCRNNKEQLATSAKQPMEYVVSGQDPGDPLLALQT